MPALVEVVAVGSRRVGLVELAEKLAELTRASSIEVELVESDEDSKSFKIVVESDRVDLRELESALLRLGLVLHEVRRVAVKTSS
ncbi:MAG: DUF211 domain-containing protein [Acidilobaceae archaeon]